jgi:two-component system, NtrC family, nitrogen regulation sensor histidine kinase GlnL
MNDMTLPAPVIDTVALALPNPILLVAPDGRVTDANPAAEAFFDISRSFLQRTNIDRLCGPNSALATLVRQAQEAGTSFNIYRADLSSPRQRTERLGDVHASPLPEQPGVVIVMIHERTIADKFNRQLSHRDSVRSVTALSAMLAHEIKNPLSGIRGAAQLLDAVVPDDDRVLTQLIRDETDRIVKLVDRFEMFSDGRMPPMEPVNIHVVLDHVRHLARSGFGRHIRITIDYDPSLPPVLCNKDQMIQVLLNLVKNAAEAIGTNSADGEIQLTTAYRPGVRMAVPGSGERPSKSACGTTGPACLPISGRTCSTPSSRRRPPEMALVLHWQPR